MVCGCCYGNKHMSLWQQAHVSMATVLASPLFELVDDGHVFASEDEVLLRAEHASQFL